MFAVCSSWFEIDERKWTYYHHGSHNDWELGAKTTTVPTSKVLDSEWHRIVICKPSVTALSLLRSPHDISVFTFCLCLFGKPHFIHAPRCCGPLAWLRWALAPEYYMCHPKAFVYIMWLLDTWRSAVRLAGVTRFPCMNSGGIINGFQ